MSHTSKSPRQSRKGRSGQKGKRGKQKSGKRKQYNRKGGVRGGGVIAQSVQKRHDEQNEGRRRRVSAGLDALRAPSEARLPARHRVHGGGEAGRRGVRGEERKRGRRNARLLADWDGAETCPRGWDERTPNLDRAHVVGVMRRESRLATRGTASVSTRRALLLATRLPLRTAVRASTLELGDGALDSARNGKRPATERRAGAAAPAAYWCVPHRRSGCSRAHEVLCGKPGARCGRARFVLQLGVAFARRLPAALADDRGHEPGRAGREPARDASRGAGPQRASAAAVWRQLVRRDYQRGVGGLPHETAGGVQGDGASATTGRRGVHVVFEPMLPHEGHRHLVQNVRHGARVHRRVLLSLQRHVRTAAGARPQAGAVRAKRPPVRGARQGKRMTGIEEHCAGNAAKPHSGPQFGASDSPRWPSADESAAIAPP
ncbi:Ubiquinone/menaquinone biosynthesis methyltransferase-like protein [Gracilaria domingensis]|nr:Ubiquinone/menaquinone biosynthesis methyltransferase-like protein [Gracilaria domingensis]